MAESTIKFTHPYKGEIGVGLYEVDDKRYVGVADLICSNDGWSHYTTRTCCCCGAGHSEPFGPVARTFQEMLEMGWVIPEADYEAWREKRDA